MLAAAAALLASLPAAALARPRRTEPPLAAPGTLEVAGAADAFYYEPKGRGGQLPVFVYLHGRSGNPADDCFKWAPVVRPHGWLLCPSGQEDRGLGARGWSNNWPAAQQVVDRSLAALLRKAGRRARARGNVLMGFSEGAYVAMNVGVREPETFSRWLILAANDVYWGGEGVAELRKNRARVHRVYLLTGERDEVVEASRRVFDTLDATRVHVVLRTPDDLGHEVPERRMRELYDRPLRWLLGLR